MVESKSEGKPIIEYANLCQSLHIGINKYDGIFRYYGDIQESHNDVDKL